MKLETMTITLLLALACASARHEGGIGGVENFPIPEAEWYVINPRRMTALTARMIMNGEKDENMLLIVIDDDRTSYAVDVLKYETLLERYVICIQRIIRVEHGDYVGIHFPDHFVPDRTAHIDYDELLDWLFRQGEPPGEVEL